MKKVLALSMVVLLTVGYSFAQDENTTPDFSAIVDTLSESIDTLLMQFLEGIGSQTQQIVEDNVQLYLRDYCTANDVLASTDVVDCGKYQGLVHVLDGILGNMVPDIDATLNLGSNDVASIDEAQVIIEETNFEVQQTIAKFDTLAQIMHKALEKPNLSDKQVFGIKYTLFVIASMKSIFALLPDFLASMTGYVENFRTTLQGIGAD